MSNRVFVKGGGVYAEGSLDNKRNVYVPLRARRWYNSGIAILEKST